MICRPPDEKTLQVLGRIRRGKTYLIDSQDEQEQDVEESQDE